MNLFILDRDPELAAQYQCDKHVNKMLLETTQLLCTALNETGTPAPYKSTHKNHPCSIWTRQNRSNFEWVKKHAFALSKEYSYRYGKVHKCDGVLRSLSEPQNIPEGALTSFVQAVPEDLKSSDPVWSYRVYYIRDKSYFAKWNKGRPSPGWFREIS